METRDIPHLLTNACISGIKSRLAEHLLLFKNQYDVQNVYILQCPCVCFVFFHLKSKYDPNICIRKY